MASSFFTAGLLILTATGAGAAIVDFENEFPLQRDPTVLPVGQAYVNQGITFTSTEAMRLVTVGGRAGGFLPGDTPGLSATGPGDLGKVFLTGDFDGNTDMNLSFASELSSIAFDIVDIDGGDDTIVGDADEEQFTFSAFLGGDLIESRLLTSRDMTGDLNDAAVARLSFGGLFDSIRIVGTTPGGTRDIGWGIDNIQTVDAATVDNNTAPVPLPASALLMLSALAGIGAIKTRRRRS